MAVTQYIGSRYVPLFADPAEWSSANAYEALTIVLHEGNSFTSKQPVPVGVDISNDAYWAETGNYNAQVEQYRREVARVSDDIETETQARIDADAQIVQDLGAETQARIDADAQIVQDLGAETQARIDEDEALNERCERIEGSDFSFEYGEIPNACIFTQFTFPKEKFRVDLKPVSTSGLIPGQALANSMSLIEYARRSAPFFAMNINPSQNFIYNGTLYGNDYEASATGKTGFYGTTEDGEIKCQRGGHFVDLRDNLGCSAVTAAWQPLVLNGVAQAINEYDTFLNPQPWQIFAQDANNLYVFTMYARFGAYVGLTLEAARNWIINNRGWADVYAFDSGGSNQVVTGDPAQSYSMLIDVNYQWREQYSILEISRR